MNPIFCAIDTPDLAAAESLVAAIAPHVGGIKLGLEFFLKQGAEGYGRLAAQGLPIFLDLKLHDIPNTVAGAVSSVLALKPAFVTIHATGGAAMLRAAAHAATQAKETRPKLLAVTLLTSLDAQDLADLGITESPKDHVRRLARLAQVSGMDGVICSPEEIADLRAEFGPDFTLMVPGIRPEGSESHDQKRVLTPRQAQESGATHLVIGRPITKAQNPAAAARDLAAGLIF